MGEEINSTTFSPEMRKQFANELIDDLKALEYMVDHQMFDTGPQRIGVEQELCLINYALRPEMNALKVLEALNDDQFTTELAKFNMEANLHPQMLTKDCFTVMENELIRLLIKANKTAHEHGAKVILTGILPTIRNSDIKLENMTPSRRFIALNDAICASRGSDFEFNIHGIDELITRHDSIIFESCNTSFQVHLQLTPDRFVDHYNWGQAISGPVLASATNSPMFLGKRLWDETRIALFQQSTDMRQNSSPLREERPRVSFGEDWEKGTIVDMYREIVSRYRPLIPSPMGENAFDKVSAGEIPKLRALSMHNGTIYKWNRSCYGITKGVPHLRLENRYLPSGPTIVDEVANAAFWIGVMQGQPEKYKQIQDHLDFDQVKENFFNAAKHGIGAQFSWFDDQLIPARDLIIKEMLPMAETGLKKTGVSDRDINKYLSIIEARAESGKTGSRWILKSFQSLKKEVSADEALLTLTEGIYQRQKAGNPVHLWEAIDLSEGGSWNSRYEYVEQIMTKDLITVHEDDVLEMVRNIMLWSNIHHIPVENMRGELIGLVSSDKLLARLDHLGKEGLTKATVGEVMIKNVFTVDPGTTTKEAHQIMQSNEIGCLPVVSNKKLIGIVTGNDYLKLIGKIFEELNQSEVS